MYLSYKNQENGFLFYLQNYTTIKTSLITQPSQKDSDSEITWRALCIVLKP